MEKIVFNDKSYEIDKAALSTATNDLIAHLATIAGEGVTLVIGGVQYNVDPNKLATAASDLEVAFSELSGSDDTVVGTWMFKETIELPGTLFDVVFVSNGNNYDAIDDYNGLIYVSKDGVADTAYYLWNSRWETEEFRTIEILEEPTDKDFIAWLKANATPEYPAAIV